MKMKVRKTKMENNIDLTMADRLQELRDEKEQLEISLKETNAMVTAELDSLKRNGHSYSLNKSGHIRISQSRVQRRIIRSITKQRCRRPSTRTGKRK